MVITSVAVMVDAASSAVDITPTTLGTDLVTLVSSLRTLGDDDALVELAVLDRAEEIGAYAVQVEGSLLLLSCCDLDAEAASGETYHATRFIADQDVG